MRLKKPIFWIHLVAGSFSGAVILFLSLTGCILTYERQMVAWAEHSYVSPPPSASARRMPLDALISIASAAAGKQPSGITVQADDRAPVEIEFGKDDRLFLNRYTGAVLGAGATRTRAFFKTVTGLHRWFGVSTDHRPAARALQGAFDLSLLLMILTGVVLWCPNRWTWSRLKTGAFLRSGLAGKARTWNRHNAIGFWAALPLTVIVVTGAILSYSWATNLLYHLAGSPAQQATAEAAPAKVPRHRDSGLASRSFVTLDQIFMSTQQQAIGWHSLTAALPRPYDREMTVGIDFLDGSRPDDKAQVVVDRATGAVVELNTFSTYSLGRKLRLFVRNVHTGEAGGILGQTVSGLAALSCCALVWTGTSLALMRFRRLWNQGYSDRKAANRDRANHPNIPIPLSSSLERSGADEL
jgi:uncharacterized iron-regulated membrane protein